MDTMILLAKDCTQSENDYYFVADELNLLFKLNIKNNQIEIVDSIPEKIVVQKDLMGAICIYGRELYIAPYITQKIWIYNLDTKKWTGLLRKNLEHIGAGGMMQAFVYEEKIYMIGTSYPAIIVINPDSKKVDYIEAPFQIKSKDMIKDAYFRAQHVVKNGYLYLASCVDNTILKINLHTYEFEWISVGEKENRFSGIVYDGQYFWLSPRNNSFIVQWDGENHALELALPKVYTQEINYFLGAMVVDHKIVLCSMINNASLEISCDSLKIQNRVGCYSFAKEEKGVSVYQDKNGEFVIQNDGKTMYEGILKIDRKLVEQHFRKKGLSFFGDEHIYQEGNIYSIKQFIDNILN